MATDGRMEAIDRETPTGMDGECGTIIDADDTAATEEEESEDAERAGDNGNDE